jgi:hypothetical protein
MGPVEKTHRNILLFLQHCYEIITHPASIIIVFFVIGAAFCATRYIGRMMENDIIILMSEDLGKALVYIASIAVTHILTKQLDKRL